MRDYNSRLKHIRYKGLCGDLETVEVEEVLVGKVEALAAMVETSKHTVIFTGAGISTSCGIADFRGPNGVWTREQKGEKVAVVDPTHNAFNHARPSFTHNAIACLLHAGVFTHLVSQNVDGLHLRSGVGKAQLSELHGYVPEYSLTPSPIPSPNAIAFSYVLTLTRTQTLCHMPYAI
jgi:mono-ADP-ribosyltransferase sirtuin 6